MRRASSLAAAAADSADSAAAAAAAAADPAGSAGGSGGVGGANATAWSDDAAPGTAERRPAVSSVRQRLLSARAAYARARESPLRVVRALVNERAGGRAGGRKGGRARESMRMVDSERRLATLCYAS